MRKAGNKVLLALLFLVAVTSCHKSSDNSTTTTTGTVVGFWGGSGVTSGVTQAVSIVFKSDGKSLRFYNGVSKASDTAALVASSKVDGTYTVSNTSVTGSYTYLSTPLLLAATANSSFTTMTGTAGVAPASTGLGTFTFTKQ
jgi:hypothetical protein